MSKAKINYNHLLRCKWVVERILYHGSDLLKVIRFAPHIFSIYRWNKKRFVTKGSASNLVDEWKSPELG